NCETSSISDPANILRDFRSMSVTVKNSKQADDAHRRGRPRFDVERNDCAEHHNRKRYTHLDKRNPDAGDAERARDSHDNDERHWNEPKRSPPELPREDADHQHREDVIEAGNRMPKPMYKAGRVADPSVGNGNGRRKESHCRSDQ